MLQENRDNKSNHTVRNCRIWINAAKRSILVLAVLFSFCRSTEAESIDLINDTIILKGYIDSNVTITTNSIFIVQQNVRINKGVTMTIDPGATLYFWPRTTVVLAGGLVVNGAPNNFSYITSLDPDEQGIGFIIRGSAEDRISMRYCQVSELLVPVEFETNWFRASVEIQDNIFRNMSTGEPAFLVNRPDYERSFEEKTSGHFSFERNVFSNNWGSILFESLEEARMEYIIQDNVITNNVNYGKTKGRPETSPIWGMYDAADGMDYVATVKGNTIYGNYQINSSTDTIVHEVAFGIKGEADIYKIPENYFMSQNLKYINASLNHFYSNNELPLLDPKPIATQPSSVAHAHVAKVVWDDTELKTTGITPTVYGSKVAMELQFNRPVNSLNNRILEYAFFDTIDNVLNVKRVGIFDTAWSGDRTSFFFNIRNPRFLNNPMGYLLVNNMADDEGFPIPEFSIGQIEAINNYGNFYWRVQPDVKIPSVEVIIDRAKVQISDETLETIQKMIDAIIKREVEKYKSK